MMAPWNIGIFGSYNAVSQGDLALLEGILHQWQRAQVAVRFTVFAFDPAFVRDSLRASSWSETTVVPAHPLAPRPPRADAAQPATKASSEPPRRLPAWVYDSVLLTRYSAFWRQQRKRLQTLDILLIGGGGLLVDLYPRWPIYPLVYAGLARSVGVPVMFYGVGAGPINTARGRRYLTWALRLSQGVTVRDAPSLQVVRALGRVPPVSLAADPALALPPVGPGAAPRALCPTSPCVGINALPLFRPGHWPIADAVRYRRYVRRMAILIADLLEQHEMATIVLLSTNCPKDWVALREIRRQLPARLASRVTLLADCRLETLRAQMASLDLVVGTRLHTALLAAVEGTPIVGLAYQPKVAAFFEALGLAEALFPVEPLLVPSDEPFAAMRLLWRQRIAEYLSAPGALRTLLAARVAALRERAQRSVVEALTILRRSRPSPRTLPE